MPDIGERIAGLEAEFRSFKEQILTDNSYIKGKLDVIVTALSAKVGVEAYDRDAGKLNTRLHNLEIKAPAIIQTVTLGIVMGVVMAIINYLVSKP